MPYSIAADAVDAAEDENELVLIMFGSAGGGGIVLLQLGSLSVEWRSRLGTGEQGKDVSSHSSRHSTTESLFLSFSVMVFARRGKRERERAVRIASHARADALQQLQLQLQHFFS